MPKLIMELGKLDVCLRVADARRSLEFYSGLGFKQVEGDTEEGWVVVANGFARIGLFESKFMGDTPFYLNFRGGHVTNLTRELTASGNSFEGEPKLRDNGCGSARLRDPDGHLIFLDTAPGEIGNSE
jgi:catechol 2,3-dioxygenase-like lactoylglutathione lyase family enzyme